MCIFIFYAVNIKPYIKLEKANLLYKVLKLLKFFIHNFIDAWNKEPHGKVYNNDAIKTNMVVT